MLRTVLHYMIRALPATLFAAALAYLLHFSSSVGADLSEAAVVLAVGFSAGMHYAAFDFHLPPDVWRRAIFVVSVLLTFLLAIAVFASDRALRVVAMSVYIVSDLLLTWCLVRYCRSDE